MSKALQASPRDIEMCSPLNNPLSTAIHFLSFPGSVQSLQLLLAGGGACCSCLHCACTTVLQHQKGRSLRRHSQHRIDMLMSALTIIKRNRGREGEGEEKKREQERERERGERQRRRESYYKRLAEAISRVNVTILRVIAAR